MEVIHAVNASNDEKLISKVDRALHIISRTIDLYGVQHVAFSFNGGKDCTVLLHLIRAAVAQKLEDDTSGKIDGIEQDKGLGGVTTFFFHSDADFTEINQFTFDTNDRYKLNMAVMTGDFKGGLETLINETGIQAIILGTRSGDPNAPGQETFCPSSKGWPPFMRVNPVLDWSYHDVWSFMQTASLPYCELYDRGYTSLGSVKNTLPNSALLREDGTYAPAYMLPDARLERAGRLKSASANIISRQSSMVLPDTKTAALLIIGDEILSAKVEDVNTAFLCSEIRSIGWKVCKVVIVQDNASEIAKEVERLSCSHDVVLTSGGLGPTLDDVTMAGVAEAFGCQLARHPELENRIRAFFGSNVTEAHLKMSEAPTGSEVAIIEYRINNGELSPFPLVRCRNVYVLPGIPALLQKKWIAVKDALLSHGGQLPFHTVMLRLKLTDETRIAAALEDVASCATFCGQVALGSYPVSGQDDGCGVVLCLESKNDELLEEARKRLVELLPEDIMVASQHRDDTALNSPADVASLPEATGP